MRNSDAISYFLWKAPNYTKLSYIFEFKTEFSDDSIDVTNDEEPDQKEPINVTVPNFVSHTLYGHAQVSFP